MLTNTQYFRESAIHYEKHGYYPDGDIGTREYRLFWEEEYRRCLFGYKVGDTAVTGYHYWYLNHWPIVKVDEVAVRNDGGLKKRKRGIRRTSFPDFWDVDYEFFWEVEYAEREGQHMVWLKPRGVGASYKAGAMAGRNFFLIPKSRSFMFAYEKEYLIKDGIISKFVEGRNYVNKMHPYQTNRMVNGFGKASDYKDDFNNMVFRASTNSQGQEVGYGSEVIGVTFSDNFQKGRGKRGKLILWEEFGRFPNAEKSWNITRDSVEQGDTTFGFMLGFGTGGTEGADFESLEKMFYTPEAFNVRAFDNIWDEGLQGTKCGYFTPAYRDIAFKDIDGNSLKKEAKAYYDGDREKARKSPDPNTFLQRKAEKPYCPQDAVISVRGTVLPRAEVKHHYNRIIADGLAQNTAISGHLINTGTKIKFMPDNNLKPILTYPHKPDEDLSGCIVQYHAPLKIDGKVPDNLYIIAHDPYAHNSSSDMSSLGATYVYMQKNNKWKGDKIVATYFGRPRTLDEYNRNLFLLAQYYNAKIGFENNRGSVIDYAKRFKLLKWLAPEFELAFDANLKSAVRRNYGMHMNATRKTDGITYLANWLIHERAGSNPFGEGNLMNLHTITCPATLREIELFVEDKDKNFDRISALIILVYYMKELQYKDVQARIARNRARSESLFEKELFV